jgi:hypothetical protein
MLLKMALFLVATIVLATIELRLFWRLGENDDRRRRRQHTDVSDARAEVCHRGIGRAGDPSRLSMWRRRHLHVRAVLALIVLSSLLVPGVAALIVIMV